MPLVAAVYYAILLAATVICFLRWSVMSQADRALLYLLIAAFLYEISSFALLRIFGQNAFLSHFYSPLEFFLVSLYFNYSLTVLRGRIGIFAGLFGAVCSVLNTLFLQPLSNINSHFLLFESTVIMLYCLMAFHQLLNLEEASMHRFTLFWIAVCFMMFWGATFMGWGMFSYFEGRNGALSLLHIRVLQTAAYLLYIGLALVFWRYKSLIPSGQHAR